MAGAYLRGVLIRTTTVNEYEVSISGYVIQERDEEKLLEVTLDRGLSFTNHISNLYKKSWPKLHALTRVSKYMESLS